MSLVERVSSLASFACLLFRTFEVDGWKEASPPFESEMATVGRLDSGLSMCACGKRELSFA